VSTIVGLVITEIVVVVLQSISSVVQSTAGALVYIDCRMRYEGLDQDLMATVERRAAGLDDGTDPFRVDQARAVQQASSRLRPRSRIRCRPGRFRIPGS
jgi:hypothetical protein